MIRPKVKGTLALEQGAVAFLQKPVKTDELLSALWKATTHVEALPDTRAPQSNANLFRDY
jgi:FixJ family two-component response regulator